jgi:HSP20 family molecular chaperone IbpA
MNQRMQEFEDESRKWREQFLSSSSMSSPSQQLSNHRPRMFVNFPEFSDMGSNFGSRLNNNTSVAPSLSQSNFFPSSHHMTQATHKSFLEEDDHGHKKYKMTFEIGDFKPAEIQVKTEGRQLIVKGDREFKAGSAVESKQFNREITLPDFVEPTSVVSFLSDGTLTVEAPVIVDRLDYQPNSNNSLNGANVVSSSSTSSSSSSNMRNSPFKDNNNNINISSSPFRENSSPSRSRNNNNNNLSSQSTFNAPTVYNDLPTNPIVQLSQSPTTTTTNPNQPAIYKFNMSEFRPEDISITVTDTSLKIHAVREENDARGGGKSYREFKREIGLPQGADVKRLKNSLQSDGTLYIEIPVQDNSNFRPPLSPTEVNKSFNNLTLNSESAGNSTMTSNVSSTNNNNNNSNLIGNISSSNNNNNNSNSSTKDALIEQTNTGKELRLTFDLTGYKPEDLSVKVIDNNTLKVHAVHIDNSRGNQIHREYTRQYILPDWVQPELLRARMSDDGTLTVEIPMPQAQPSKFERNINIQNSNR